nr:hypothetical protein [uncultured Desulfobulbus sp.]
MKLHFSAEQELRKQQLLMGSRRRLVVARARVGGAAHHVRPGGTNSFTMA